MEGELPAHVEDSQPAAVLPQEQAVLLGRYVALFNARDFDALRAMLAEDVRLELVGMTEKSGAADVNGYFTNYARLAGIRLEAGVVDGRPAILAREQPDGARSTACSCGSAANGFSSSETTATRSTC